MKDFYEFLFQHFLERGWMWSLKGRGLVPPTPNDFKNALDEAAKILYSEDAGGDMLQLGRLIVIKQKQGLDVYVLADTISAEDAQLSLKEKND